MGRGVGVGSRHLSQSMYTLTGSDNTWWACGIPLGTPTQEEDDSRAAQAQWSTHQSSHGCRGAEEPVSRCPTSSKWVTSLLTFLVL